MCDDEARRGSPLIHRSPCLIVIAPATHTSHRLSQAKHQQAQPPPGNPPAHSSLAAMKFKDAGSEGLAMEPHEVAPLVEAAEEVRVEEERALKERIAARLAAEAAVPGWKEGRAADSRKLSAYKTLEEGGGRAVLPGREDPHEAPVGLGARAQGRDGAREGGSGGTRGGSGGGGG